MVGSKYHQRGNYKKDGNVVGMNKLYKICLVIIVLFLGFLCGCFRTSPRIVQMHKGLVLPTTKIAILVDHEKNTSKLQSIDGIKRELVYNKVRDSVKGFLAAGRSLNSARSNSAKAYDAKPSVNFVHSNDPVVRYLQILPGTHNLEASFYDQDFWGLNKIFTDIKSLTFEAEPGHVYRIKCNIMELGSSTVNHGLVLIPSSSSAFHTVPVTKSERTIEKLDFVVEDITSQFDWSKLEGLKVVECY